MLYGSREEERKRFEGIRGSRGVRIRELRQAGVRMGNGQGREWLRQ